MLTTAEALHSAKLRRAKASEGPAVHDNCTNLAQDRAGIRAAFFPVRISWAIVLPFFTPQHPLQLGGIRTKDASFVLDKTYPSSPRS